MKCKVHLGEILEFEGTISEFKELSSIRYEEYLEQRDKDIALDKEVGELLPKDRTINGWMVEEACIKFFCSPIGRKLLKINPDTIIKAVARDDMSGIDYYIAGIPVDIKQQVLKMEDMRFSYKENYVNFTRRDLIKRLDKENFRIIIVANILEEENLLWIFGFIDSQLLAHYTLSKGKGKTSWGAETNFCYMENLHSDLIAATWDSHNFYAKEYRLKLNKDREAIDS